MGARNDIFRPLDHPSFRYQTRDKRVKLKFRACRASAYIGKPDIHASEPYSRLNSYAGPTGIPLPYFTYYYTVTILAYTGLRNVMYPSPTTTVPGRLGYVISRCIADRDVEQSSTVAYVDYLCGIITPLSYSLASH
eukprot:scaffold243430_cov50-Attheya_sp.AAC.1